MVINLLLVIIRMAGKDSFGMKLSCSIFFFIPFIFMFAAVTNFYHSCLKIASLQLEGHASLYTGSGATIITIVFYFIAVVINSLVPLITPAGQAANSNFTPVAGADTTSADKDVIKV